MCYKKEGNPSFIIPQFNTLTLRGVCHGNSFNACWLLTNTPRWQGSWMDNLHMNILQWIHVANIHEQVWPSTWSPDPGLVSEGILSQDIAGRTWSLLWTMKCLYLPPVEWGGVDRGQAVYEAGWWGVLWDDIHNTPTGQGGHYMSITLRVGGGGGGSPQRSSDRLTTTATWPLWAAAIWRHRASAIFYCYG